MNDKVKVQVDKAVKVIQAERGMDLILVYESNVLYGAESIGSHASHCRHPEQHES